MYPSLVCCPPHQCSALHFREALALCTASLQPLCRMCGLKIERSGAKMRNPSLSAHPSPQPASGFCSVHSNQSTTTLCSKTVASLIPLPRFKAWSVPLCSSIARGRGRGFRSRQVQVHPRCSVQQRALQCGRTFGMDSLFNFNGLSSLPNNRIFSADTTCAADKLLVLVFLRGDSLPPSLGACRRVLSWSEPLVINERGEPVYPEPSVGD